MTLMGVVVVVVVARTVWIRSVDSNRTPQITRKAIAG